MKSLMEFLSQEGVSSMLLDRVAEYRKTYDAMEIPEDTSRRIPQSEVRYYGTGVWEKAIAALLSGENLLLAGPKATGKNVLAENLAELFGRPLWDVSFHVNVDASYLIGTDTYDGSRVTFRPGPIYNCAVYGGFGVLDEINMARNEALAVLHATLDFRHVIDVAGYDRISVSPAARFIGTMNYGELRLRRDERSERGALLAFCDSGHAADRRGRSSAASEGCFPGNQAEDLPAVCPSVL